MQDFLKTDFDISKIVFALRVPAGSGDAVHLNRPSHGLAIHLEGRKIYRFEGHKPIVVQKNDIIYMPKGSNYVVNAERQGECFAINFDFYENKTFEPLVFHTKNSLRFIEAFKRAAKVWQTKQPGYISACKAELYTVLSAMEKEFSTYISGEKQELISPAVEYIHENYTNESISISEISKMCNITPEYFRSLFKKTFGSSPVKYINELKISRAKELLGSGLYSVFEAATLSGYSDPSHFSREFKKAVGISPARFKENS